MARQQLGKAPSNPTDTATKGYVDAIQDLTIYSGDLNAASLGTVYVTASGSTNTPVASDGVLETWNVPSTSIKIQRYTTNGASAIYVRFYTTTWMAWNLIGGSGSGSGGGLDQNAVDARIRELAPVRDSTGWVDLLQNGVRKGLYNLDDPGNPYDAANKNYVDYAKAGLRWRSSSWDGSTTYAVGDVVNAGGKTWVAKQTNINQWPYNTWGSVWDDVLANFNFRGAYDPVQTYNIGETAQYQGSTYVAIDWSTGPWDSTKWTLLAAKGDPGSASSNVKVQATNPGLTVPGLWIETKANGDISFWVENGS